MLLLINSSSLFVTNSLLTYKLWLNYSNKDVIALCGHIYKFYNAKSLLLSLLAIVDSLCTGYHTMVLRVSAIMRIDCIGTAKVTLVAPIQSPLVKFWQLDSNLKSPSSLPKVLHCPTKLHANLWFLRGCGFCTDSSQFLDKFSQTVGLTTWCLLFSLPLNFNSTIFLYILVGKTLVHSSVASHWYPNQVLYQAFLGKTESSPGMLPP